MAYKVLEEFELDGKTRHKGKQFNPPAEWQEDEQWMNENLRPKGKTGVAFIYQYDTGVPELDEMGHVKKTGPGSKDYKTIMETRRVVLPLQPA